MYMYVWVIACLIPLTPTSVALTSRLARLNYWCKNQIFNWFTSIFDEIVCLQNNRNSLKHTNLKHAKILTRLRLYARRRIQLGSLKSIKCLWVPPFLQRKPQGTTLTCEEMVVNKSFCFVFANLSNCYWNVYTAFKKMCTDILCPHFNGWIRNSGTCM